MLEHHVAVDALRDAGRRGRRACSCSTATACRGVLRAPAVLLATGGLGQLYQATTNPAMATGDGVALALRAGAPAADLEFVQFHPTVLYTGPRRARPLPARHRGRARRGRGAGRRGRRPGHGRRAPAGRPRAARRRVGGDHPADGRARATDHVFLDATDRRRRVPPPVPDRARGVPRGRASTRRSTPIPVAPAAHFACGGVVTTVDGRTAVAGLYAAGEVARTGLHGANRLASNSLLEGLVVGTRAAEAVAADLALGAAGATAARGVRAGADRAGRGPGHAAAGDEPLRRDRPRRRGAGRASAPCSTCPQWTVPLDTGSGSRTRR